MSEVEMFNAYNNKWINVNLNKNIKYQYYVNIESKNVWCLTW